MPAVKIRACENALPGAYYTLLLPAVHRTPSISYNPQACAALCTTTQPFPGAPVPAVPARRPLSAIRPVRPAATATATAA